MSLVARRGSRAPGTPVGVNFGSEQIVTFDSPVLNDSGKVAFRAVVSGPGVDESNDEGIWAGTVNDLKLVARAGSHAPGTPAGVNFETFFPWNGALQLNVRGQSVFTAFLMGDDVIFGQNSIGIWATDITGALHLIARTGDLLEVLPGDVRTILDLSFVNDGTGNSDGRASGINDRGQIVFWAKLAGGDEGIFVSNLVAVPEPGSLMLVAMCAATLSMRRMRRITVPLTLCFAVSLTTAARAAQYIITDLGVDGAENTLAWSINASGQVTGYAGTPDDDTITGFIWNPTTPNSPNGTMYSLGTLGGEFSWGTGINVHGQVVGVSATTDDAAEHATLWNPTVPNAASGTLHDLGTLGGLHSQANAANVSGQVAGVADTAEDGIAHAFLWNPTTPNASTGTMHDIGSLGGSFTIGWDINSSGQVTGDSDTARRRRLTCVFVEAGNCGQHEWRHA